MGKRITEYKAVHVLLSILIAVALWFYVITFINPTDQRLMRDVPITLLGEDVLYGKGLMLDPTVDLTLDVTLVGNRNALWKVGGTNTELAVTADVTGISAPGEYPLTCKITPPGGLTVENGNSRAIKVNVIKMLSKTVEVRGFLAGAVANGYRANAFAISPAALTIQGPEAVINQIEYAQVTVSGTGLTKTYTGDLGFEYVTTEGKKLIDGQISANTNTVNVILPVVKTLEIPLAVEFTAGGGASVDSDNVEYEISPATIQISGDEADVLPLQEKSITLGVVDLAKIIDTDTVTFPIVLAPELTNDSGVSEAKVTVTVKGLATQTFETDNIEVVNVPEGFEAMAVTKSLQVSVRGTEAALSEVQGYKIRVVVDLKGQELSPGQFRPSARVYLDVNGQVGAVGEHYVVISVTRS